MSNNSKRPILVSLTSHWVSMLGLALVTTVGFPWLFVLPVQFRGHTNNPYIGIKLKSSAAKSSTHPALAGREPRYRRYHTELFDGRFSRPSDRHHGIVSRLGSHPPADV
jgi:hypothetical protein